MSDFEPSLSELVNLVWADFLRDPRRFSRSAIYNSYATAEFAEPVEFNEAQLQHFYLRLSDLSTEHQVTWEAQIDDVEGVDGWPSLDFLRQDNDADLQKEAFATFFHAVFEDDELPTTHRVYLSAVSINFAATDLMGHVLGLAIAEPQWVHAAKITAPGGQDRNDHVVVYCPDRLGQDYVVGALLDADVGHLLGTTTPAGTLAVVPGMSVADEPPALSDRDGEITRSHGSVLAAIIWSAAGPYTEGTEPPPSLSEFRQAVFEEFPRWGIDPSRPFLTSQAHNRRRKVFSAKPGSGGRGPASRRGRGPAINAAIAH